ncbi:MAG: reductive dehalogenase [Dehalococcoides mccartyi]|uniref:reductive dehalogenase n=1 Tax=Dehalococcoides mccartyi TaxID=61435 RepID=UPI0030F8201D
MSKFHSTLTRRDFMKGLGLAGAGLGAAAATTPVFHDMDEMASASSGNANEEYPWWVTERDYLDPTCDIDWDVLSRWDASNMAFNVWPAHLSQEEFNKRTSAYAVLQKNNTGTNAPGNTVMDYAISRASWASQNTNTNNGAETIDDSLFQTFKNPFTFPFGLDASGNAFLSPAFADAAGLVTPDDYGIPRWQGTPEENAAMYRTAVRICGGRETHFLPLDEKTIKLVSAAKGGKPIVFEDVDLPYTDATKCVIPNKCKYAAITMVGQEPVTTKNHAPDFGGTFGAHQAYSMAAKIEFMLRAFMRGIGYLDVFGATEINVPWGIVSGLSELSRMKSGMNPKVGSLFRKCVIGLTDMEFPVSKPIDAGMHRFCYDCGKCAEMCPAQAIVKRDVLREPTWEITSPDNPTGNPTNLKPELFNRPGKRVWPFNHFACHNLWVETASDGCGRCQGLCVFNNFHLSSIHPLVKTTVSVTPLLNSFFYNADRLFGYGELPESSREDFWLKPDKYLPITGFKNY